MPTYSYRCKDCGHEYDAFQSMTEDAHTVCPECQGTVQRLIGAGAGILFKGSGFYVTDYKSGGNGSGGGKSGSSDSSSSSSSSSGGSSSGDSSSGSKSKSSE